MIATTFDAVNMMSLGERSNTSTHPHHRGMVAVTDEKELRKHPTITMGAATEKLEVFIAMIEVTVEAEVGAHAATEAGVVVATEVNESTRNIIEGPNIVIDIKTTAKKGRGTIVAATAATTLEVIRIGENPNVETDMDHNTKTRILLQIAAQVGNATVIENGAGEAEAGVN